MLTIVGGILIVAVVVIVAGALFGLFTTSAQNRDTEAWLREMNRKYPQTPGSDMQFGSDRDPDDD